MGPVIRRFLIGGSFAAVLLVSGTAWAADDPPFISLGAGIFDWNNPNDLQPELRLEYVGRKILGPLKPVVALAGTFCPGRLGRTFNYCPGKGNTGSGFFGGGTQVDFFSAGGSSPRRASPYTTIPGAPATWTLDRRSFFGSNFNSPIALIIVHGWGWPSPDTKT